MMFFNWLKLKIKIVMLGLIMIIVILNPLHAENPKNIIVLICDGCGFNHVEASSYYEFGMKGGQVYEQFPVQYAMSTYSASGNGYDPKRAWQDFKYVTRNYTDSGAAATAMATGSKTYNYSIGVDTIKWPLVNIVERCELLGKATGVVTSVMFCDATPASFVTHHGDRHEKDIIAKQMILKSKLEVLMGTGHPEYDNRGRMIKSKKRDYKHVGDQALWEHLRKGEVGNDCDGDGVDDPWLLIEDREAVLALSDSIVPKRVMVVPKVDGTLQEKRKGNRDIQPFQIDFNLSVPSLSEMAIGALHVLSQDSNGFFLMIEGGAVDWAGHDHLEGQLIEEMRAFNHTVQQVINWIESNSSWDETLIIVTADHETGYLWGKKSGRGRFGWLTGAEPRWRPLENRGKGVVPGMKWYRTSHTNSLVPFYAKGAGSEIFQEYADEEDPVRGAYMDNTELGQALFRLTPRE